MKYNVIYNKSIDLNTLRSTLEGTGVVVNDIFESIGVINLTASDTSFSSIDGVLSFELEQEMTMEPCDDWHLRRINTAALPIRPMYLPKNTGNGSVVYLVDTGVDTTHPELSGANVVNLWSYDGTFTDSLGHGTAMASVIVGNTLGVVKDSTIKVVKIPYGAGVTNTTLLQAFDTILTDHLSTPSTVKVVNCSWVIAKSQVLDTKIAELQSNGLVVVAAAGNQVQAADNYSPVGLDTVIGVAAADAYDRVINWSTGVGSNWGPEVDITAPGIDISCAQSDGTIGTSSGTSLAAAIVSGVVAQFVTQNTTMTAAQIQTAVIDHSKEDLLFRNEAIYGTTPNRLLQCLFFGGIFTQPNILNETDKIFVQKGTTQTFAIEVAGSAPVARLSIAEFQTGRITRIPPSWVSLDTTTNIITFSPPVELDTKKYMVFVEALSADDIQVGYVRFIVHVYTDSPSELSTENKPEYYTANPTTNTIILALAYCYTGSCPSNCSGFATKGGGFCACSWTYGACNSS
jgi:hypothetical protein